MSQELFSIPASPTAFFDYQRNLVTRCVASATLWALPTAKMTAINAARATYEAAYYAAVNDTAKNTQLVVTRDAATETYKPLLEDLLRHNIVNNAAIAPADKVALGIHTTGGNTNTPAAAPANAPLVNLVTEKQAALYVVYSDPSSPTSHSKPTNVAFCELVCKVGDPAPASPTDCPEKHYVSRSHEAINFEQKQRGSKIYAYARWVNKNGKQGPWCSLITTIIP